MSGVKLTVSITYAAFDPRRGEIFNQLLRQLGSSPADIRSKVHDLTVIADNKRSGAWPVQREAWGWATKAGGTHHLLLEEDIVVCRDFLLAVQEALAHKPDAIVSFFYTRKRGLQQALDARSSWLRTRSNVFGQAIAMPTPMAQDFMTWQALHLRQPMRDDGTLEPLYADTRIACYREAHKLDAWLTIPSLIDHVGMSVSTVNHTVPAHSSVFIGTDRSGLSIDWTRGLPHPPMEKDQGMTKRHVRTYYVP